jgi:hypothetical protein
MFTEESQCYRELKQEVSLGDDCSLRYQLWPKRMEKVSLEGLT